MNNGTVYWHGDPRRKDRSEKKGLSSVWGRLNSRFQWDTQVEVSSKD